MNYYKNGDQIIATVGTLNLPEITADEYQAKFAETDRRIQVQSHIEEARRPLTESEVSRLLIAQQINNLTVDDATASRMVDFYPTLKQDGSLIKANSRINWGGKLKRAAVDLWDTEINNPDNAPTLWEDIEYRDGIRVIPEAITATDPFKLGDYGWWGDDLYQSIYDGDNVWTPEGYPAAWTKINL